MTPYTEFDKVRAMQQLLDEARTEIKFLRRELGLCQEMTTKQSQES